MTTWYRRFREWVDTRVGLTGTILRPGPHYSLNVFYWLGALLVVAFLFQGLTGLLMLVYYTPSVDQAYSSTSYIINTVPLGRLLQTVHLYSAYAMVLLTFLHMMRGYFVSVQKRPREFMWIVGMLMGLVVLAFGLTGYLLPWTVVSKSATDVTISMIDFLPAQIGPNLRFLIAGTGGDAAELARFFDLHIVVLPAIMTGLIAIKLYMFEVHGAAEPPSGQIQNPRLLPWFPDLFVYFSVIGLIFVAVLLAVSAVFPLSLPPAYTPQAAATYVSQPEWYFLWIYQILKFAVFEGGAVVAALVAVTIGGIIMVLLPFFDRSRERDPAKRPLYTTVGLVLIAELIVLTIWGYYTPGQIIPDIAAITVIGGVALAVAFMSLFGYRIATGRIFTRNLAPSRTVKMARFIGTPFKYPRLTFAFTLLLAISSASFSSAATLLSTSQSNPIIVTFTLLAGAVSLYLMISLVKSLVRADIHRMETPSL